MNKLNCCINISNNISKKLFDMHHLTTSCHEFDQMMNSVFPFFNYFGLDHFYYVRILPSGHYTTLGTNNELHEFTFDHAEMFCSYPYVRHPKNLREGIFIETNSIDLNYLNSLKMIFKKFKSKFTICIRKGNHNGFETFGFCTKFPVNKVVNSLVNELPLVHKFIEFFCLENQKLMQIAYESQVDMLPLVASSFYEKEEGIIDLPDKTKLLKHMSSDFF